MRIDRLVQDGVFSPEKIARELRTTQRELAGTLGLGADAFTRISGIRARKSQMRLRQMAEIMHRLEPEMHSPIAAYAWFRSARIPGFGGATPDMLVRDGRGGHVHGHLDRILSGGYA